MADFKAIAGIIAGSLAVLAMIPYVASIVRGTTRPSRSSWLIWTLVAFVLLASYRKSGATDTIWLAGAYFLIPLTILTLSFKYGVGGTSALDQICLAGAGVGISAGLAFHSAPAVLFVCIAVDALGAVPTLRKSYRDPLSEDLRGWAIGLAASTLNLAAVTDWAPQISLYPLYSFVLAAIVSATLYVRGRMTGCGVEAIPLR